MPPREVVAVDDRAAVGLVRERAQRVHRRVQVRLDRSASHALVDVELERRQAARIDRVDRDVVPVRCVVDVAQVASMSRLRRRTRARSSCGCCRRRSDCRAPGCRAGIARRRRASAAAAMLVNPSLTRMSDLRPSLSAAHVHDQRPDRGQRHLVADLLPTVSSDSTRSAPRTRSSARSRTCGRRTARSPLMTARDCASRPTSMTGSSGYITPIMSDGPSWVSTNCASGFRTACSLPRRT